MRGRIHASLVALALLLGGCGSVMLATLRAFTRVSTRPRPNGVDTGRYAAPGWERGALAGAEAQAGASFSGAWDSPDGDFGVVGTHTGPDGQRMVNEVFSERMIDELEIEMHPDAGLDVDALSPGRTDRRGMRGVDGGPDSGGFTFRVDQLDLPPLLAPR